MAFYRGGRCHVTFLGWSFVHPGNVQLSSFRDYRPRRALPEEIQIPDWQSPVLVPQIIALNWTAPSFAPKPLPESKPSQPKAASRIKQMKIEFRFETRPTGISLVFSTRLDREHRKERKMESREGRGVTDLFFRPFLFYRIYRKVVKDLEFQVEYTNRVIRCFWI